MVCKPSNTEHSSIGRFKRPGRILLYRSQEEPTLLTPRFRTSSLQSYETHFCCFKPPSLWCFVLGALTNGMPFFGVLLPLLFLKLKDGYFSEKLDEYR